MNQVLLQSSLASRQLTCCLLFQNSCFLLSLLHLPRTSLKIFNVCAMPSPGWPTENDLSGIMQIFFLMIFLFVFLSYWFFTCILWLQILCFYELCMCATCVSF